MQSSDTKLQFEFNNSTDALIASLQYMLGHITANIPADADTEDILFRSKVIITELLTNAIKHGGRESTLFDIEISANQLSIQKIDQGTPLYLVDNPKHSPSDSQTENRKLISADPMNLLYAYWEKENAIRFISEETSIEDFLSVEQVMEHFGILIITRASDEFTYTYHKDTSSNIFKVRINF
jgi:anti-sigma regulatory factor (Ser/Thr protein kinase)